MRPEAKFVRNRDYEPSVSHGMSYNSQPPFPACCERGRPVVDRVGVPLELWPLVSSSIRGMGSSVACIVSGEPLVDVEGECESLGEG